MDHVRFFKAISFEIFKLINFVSNSEMNKRISREEAIDIYTKAEKIEEAFGEHFTAVIQGENYEEVYNLCKEAIADQAGPIIWVPQKDPL